MPHQHRAIQLTGEIRQRLERRVGRGQAAIADVGHALLRELVDCGHRELSVREGSARLRAEAEVRPDDLVAESQQGGQAARGRRARAHVVEEGLIEARPPAPHLVRHVHRMALAHEVLVPAHPTVRRRLPRLAGQGRAMDHHHRDVAVTALRHHVPHVHLVDGDVAPRAEVAQLHLGLFGLLAADEEAALCLQHQGRVGCLQIRDGLRRHSRGRPERDRNRDDGEQGPSARHRGSAESPRASS